MYLLSGGQKSRVAFALCVFNNPHILILDEPTKFIFILTLIKNIILSVKFNLIVIWI